MFKKLLLATALLSTSAIANTQNEEFKSCKVLEQTAGLVMQARQDGMAMSDLLEAVQHNKLGQAVVIDAFKVSRYHTQSMKQRAVQDFKNLIFKTCYNEIVAKKV